MWPSLINMLIANPKRFESKVLWLLYITLHMYPNTRNVQLSDHVFYMFQRSEDAARK